MKCSLCDRPSTLLFPCITQEWKTVLKKRLTDAQVGKVGYPHTSGVDETTATEGHICKECVYNEVVCQYR